MAFLSILLAGTMVLLLLERTPDARDVMVTEGKVVSAEWKNLRRPRFEIRLDAAPSLVFQPRPPPELAADIANLIRMGDVVKVGHNERSLGRFNSNRKVYSLVVNGAVLYSLDDYRRWNDSNRPVWWGVLVGSTILATLLLLLARLKRE